MKLDRLETHEKFMLDLQWNIEDLEKAKIMLKEWDEIHASFYRSKPKYIIKLDLAEREHLRNAIKFWDKRSLDENKSP